MSHFFPGIGLINVTVLGARRRCSFHCEHVGYAQLTFYFQVLKRRDSAKILPESFETLADLLDFL
jgi:hypothetical protein